MSALGEEQANKFHKTEIYTVDSFGKNSLTAADQASTLESLQNLFESVQRNIRICVHMWQKNKARR